MKSTFLNPKSAFKTARAYRPAGRAGLGRSADRRMAGADECLHQRGPVGQMRQDVDGHRFRRGRIRPVRIHFRNAPSALSGGKC